jgi:hypothetical protein
MDSNIKEYEKQINKTYDELEKRVSFYYYLL